MGESVTKAAELISILAGALTVVALIKTATSRLIENYRNPVLNQIGLFFKANDLKQPSKDTKFKFCNLLKHDIDEWSDFYYWSQRNEEVLNKLRAFNKVLIIGPSGLGKTRLVIEVLRHVILEKTDFKDLNVVAVNSSLDANSLANPKKKLWRKWGNLALVLDDVERYRMPDVIKLVADFRKISSKLIIVATCREEEFSKIITNPETSSLFPEKNRVFLREYSYEEGKKIADGTKKPFPEVFSGTADHIVLQTLENIHTMML
jgi:hypothetical protein